MTHPPLCLEASQDAFCSDSKNIFPCPSQGSSKKGEDERPANSKSCSCWGRQATGALLTLAPHGLGMLSPRSESACGANLCLPHQSQPALSNPPPNSTREGGGDEEQDKLGNIFLGKGNTLGTQIFSVLLCKGKGAPLSDLSQGGGDTCKGSHVHAIIQS